jgi:hypothetical protein
MFPPCQTFHFDSSFRPISLSVAKTLVHIFHLLAIMVNARAFTFQIGISCDKYQNILT